MLKYDLAGKTFSYLTVIDRAPRQEKTPATFWNCRCECGKILAVDSSRLRNGRTGSCGCKKGARLSAKLTRHGHGNGSPEYRSWLSAIKRCHNPKTQGFEHYGGRGIAVCDQWREDFSSFLAYMGKRPDGHTLERKNVNLGYQPGNCCWATPKEQSQNKRTNRHVRIGGDVLTIRQASDKYNLPYDEMRSRLYKVGRYGDAQLLPLSNGNLRG